MLSSLKIVRQNLLAFGTICYMISLFSLFTFPVAASASTVIFEDIAASDGAGIDYRRAESSGTPIAEQIYQKDLLVPLDLPDFPVKWRGSPGVALLDFDSDDDLDIFVTNGPGEANSLYSNQWQETGQVQFVDVAVGAGVGLRDTDSSGVCFGDTDNDSDPDLFVLSNFGINTFFENNGDGTFTDLSSSNVLSRDVRSSVSCSFGDINGDGLLDVVVANTWIDMNNGFGIGLDPFAFNQHNQLYLNLGDNTFADVGAAAGIEALRGFPEEFNGQPSLTWAIAMVDYDLDGDMDIIHADDQGVIPLAKYGGIDRGLIHVLQNDGSGFFTDVTVESGMDIGGQWMGLAFGDVNGDGYLDMFGSNFGDFATLPFSVTPIYGTLADYELGDSTSRWFLGSGDGVFSDPGVGELVATPFGWGASMVDYDNDDDTDIIFHGGHLAPIITISDNFGVVLNNDGEGNFSYDLDALAFSTNHQRRTVHGVAVGDLNNDGFSDVVSVSNADIQPSIPVFLHTPVWNSPVDNLTIYQANLLPTENIGEWTVSATEKNAPGTLSVEINSADNGNRWAKVQLLGTVDLVEDGSVNRDGIGGVVTWTTNRGGCTMRPVTGGSSYASQDSLELVFGLGRANKGQIDVLWPGGVKNRLYKVRKQEEILFPEIPCSIDGEWSELGEYVTCVYESLEELKETGVLTRKESRRFFASAIVAFFDEQWF